MNSRRILSFWLDCTQQDTEAAPLSYRTCDADRAAHCAHKVVNDSQAKAKATGGTRARSIGAIKALKDMWQFVGGNTDAIVFNNQREVLRVCPFQADRDDTPLPAWR